MHTSRNTHGNSYLSPRGLFIGASAPLTYKAHSAYGSRGSPQLPPNKWKNCHL